MQVNYDHELINQLNNHYNKNRHIEVSIKGTTSTARKSLFRLLEFILGKSNEGRERWRAREISTEVRD